jgi:hypothetical protein
MYTKKMSEENKQMLTRAIELLSEFGWSAKNEFVNGEMTTEAIAIRRNVITVLCSEFKEVNQQRVRNRVNLAIRQERGKYKNY